MCTIIAKKYIFDDVFSLFIVLYSIFTSKKKITLRTFPFRNDFVFVWFKKTSMRFSVKLKCFQVNKSFESWLFLKWKYGWQLILMPTNVDSYFFLMIYKYLMFISQMAGAWLNATKKRKIIDAFLVKPITMNALLLINKKWFKKKKYKVH